MQAASGLGLGLHPIDWTLGFDAFVHVLVRLFAARLGAGRVDAGKYVAQQTALSLSPSRRFDNLMYRYVL
jgi:hypothetical protein